MSANSWCPDCGDDRIGFNELTPELDYDHRDYHVEYYCEMCGCTWEDKPNDPEN